MVWQEKHTTGLLGIVGICAILGMFIFGVGSCVRQDNLANHLNEKAMLDAGYCKPIRMGYTSNTWQLCVCTPQGDDLTTIEDGAGTLTVSGPSNLSK